ncbi:MAG: hypothetical protein V2A66_07795 [Pseudomonadota bacterium]
MKKKIVMAAKIAAIAAIAVGLAFLIRDASDHFLAPSYDAGAPTAAKFAKIAKWMPPKSEFEVVADVTRMFSDPAISDRLSKAVGGKGGAVAFFVEALMEKRSLVGMLMFVGSLGEAGTPPAVAVVAQGSFDEKVMIPAIRAALSSDRPGFISEKLGDRTLYAESDERDPFGFVILDREHVAVGMKSSLVALFGEGPAAAPAPAAFGPADSVIFGRLVFGPRLRAIVPQGFVPAQGVDFQSADGRNIVARIPSEEKEAHDLAVFLDGVRSLLILQNEENPVLEGILKGISIRADKQEVAVSCDVAAVLNLFPPPL